MVERGRWPVVHILSAAVVAVTLVVLGNRVNRALAVGAGFLALELGVDAAEAAIGDYAGNALVGAAVLGFAGWLAWAGGLLPAAGFSVGGGWLFFDGVQHLRYGVDRNGRIQGVTGGTGPLQAVPRLLVGRLLEPFRLE